MPIWEWLTGGKKPTKPEAARMDMKKFQAETIQLLEQPAFNIVRSLRKSIEQGKIGAIIGIDASGRLTGELLCGIIADISRAKGIPEPENRYIALGRGDEASKPEHIPELIRSWGLDKSKKVLVVDDTIQTGDSIVPLLQALSDEGYEVEVAGFATGSTRTNATQVMKQGVEVTLPLHEGDRGAKESPVWGWHELGGSERKRDQLNAPPFTLNSAGEEAHKELEGVRARVLEQYKNEKN